MDFRKEPWSSREHQTGLGTSSRKTGHGAFRLTHERNIVMQYRPGAGQPASRRRNRSVWKRRNTAGTICREYAATPSVSSNSTQQPTRGCVDVAAQLLEAALQFVRPKKEVDVPGDTGNKPDYIRPEHVNLRGLSPPPPTPAIVHNRLPSWAWGTGRRVRLPHERLPSMGVCDAAPVLQQPNNFGQRGP